MPENVATNYAEAAQILRKNLSPRQIDLEILERFVSGTQYAGLPDWFSDDVPLWERAPCIVYKIAAAAIRSNVDLVVGEKRFPAITSNPGEDDSLAGGLDEAQSKAVDRAIADVATRTRFRAVARQALAQGQGSRSVATIVGVRNGKPFLDLVRARWCEPTFAVDGVTVERLEIQYPYCTAPERQPDGTWKIFVRLYRRVIDATGDTTYLPLPADKDGKPVKSQAWEVDKARTVEKHGLGFCPVHWYAHLKECDTVASFDGIAIHEFDLDEIRGLDFALSQRHRSVLFCGDPQIVEIGVEKGYNPSEEGRTAVVPSTLKGGAPSAANPITGGYVEPGAKKARRKTPGGVWQYDTQDAKQVRVEYLTLPAGALDTLDKHAADLRNKIAESLAVVLLDPENVKFSAAMSGKAIEMLRGRQFDRCDQIRDDFGSNWILPVILLLLRVALGTKFKSAAVDAVRDTLASFVADDGSAPMLFVKWPAGYMQPDPQDDLVVVQATVAARAATNGPLITLRAAVEKLAPIYGHGNVDQALRALEDEAVEKQKSAMATMHALGGHDDDEGPAAKAPPFGKKPLTPNAEAREGGSPA